MEPERWIGPREVASILAIGRNAAYELLHSGRIASTDLGRDGRYRRLRTTASAVLAYQQDALFHRSSNEGDTDRRGAGGMRDAPETGPGRIGPRPPDGEPLTRARSRASSRHSPPAPQSADTQKPHARSLRDIPGLYK